MRTKYNVTGYTRYSMQLIIGGNNWCSSITKRYMTSRMILAQAQLTSFLFSWAKPQAPSSTPVTGSPKITILSPSNLIYDESSIPLLFVLDKPANWTGYSLDGLENVTITGNTTLAVYLMENTASQYMGTAVRHTRTSETIRFTVNSQSPDTNSYGNVVVVIVGVGLLVYFKKHKREAENAWVGIQFFCWFCYHGSIKFWLGQSCTSCRVGSHASQLGRWGTQHNSNNDGEYVVVGNGNSKDGIAIHTFSSLTQMGTCSGILAVHWRHDDCIQANDGGYASAGIALFIKWTQKGISNGHKIQWNND